MQEDVKILDSCPKDKSVGAEPCILPFIVLFSIAAQENRMAGRNQRQFGPGWTARPRMAPYYRPVIRNAGPGITPITPITPDRNRIGRQMYWG